MINLIIKTQFGGKSIAPFEYEHFSITLREGILKSVPPTGLMLKGSANKL